MQLIWLGCAPPTVMVEIKVYLESETECGSAPALGNPVENSDTRPAYSESQAETQENPCPDGMRPTSTEEPTYRLDIDEAEVRRGVA